MKYNYYELLKIGDVLNQLNVLEKQKIEECKKVFEELSDILEYYFPVDGKMPSYTYDDGVFYNRDASLNILKGVEPIVWISLFRLENNNLYTDVFGIRSPNERGVIYRRFEYKAIDAILVEDCENIFTHLLKEIKEKHILPDKVEVYSLVYVNNYAKFSFCNNMQGNIVFEKDLGYKDKYSQKQSFQKLFQCMEDYKDNCKDRVRIFQKVIDEKNKK